MSVFGGQRHGTYVPGPRKLRLFPIGVQCAPLSLLRVILTSFSEVL